MNIFTLTVVGVHNDSKGGCFQGPELSGLRASLQEELMEGNEKFFLEKRIFSIHDDLWYTVHPQFIRQQVTSSLKRLDIATLDIFYIQFPEMMLKNPHKVLSTRDVVSLSAEDAAEAEREEARKAFMRDMENCFQYLEKEVKEGQFIHLFVLF